MAKDAYYFSHDSNAHKDPKCIRLRRLAGMEGYGLFWCLIEMLRDAPENKIELSMVDDILFELRSDEKTMDAIFQAGLLEKNDRFFWSESLCRRMSIYAGIVESRSRAGKASAQKRTATKTNESSAHVQHMLNTCSTDPQQEVNTPSTNSNKGKERKEKEKKDASSHAKNAWAIWIDCNREAGRADPVAVGKDTKASQMLWKALDGDVSKIRDVFARYLNDQDRFIVDNGHSLSLLQSRINKYLNTGTHRQEPLELSL